MVKLLLWLGKNLPRGGARVTLFLAKYSKALQHYDIQLKLCPHITVIADLSVPVFYPLFRYGCYPHQIGEDLIVRAILQQKDVVYDIGANIGYTTVLYADVVGKTGHVYCFEPSRKCVHYLEENVKRWNNISVVSKAVSNLSGTIKFVERKELDRSGVLSVTKEKLQFHNNKEELYAVESTTIDEFWKTKGKVIPQFIKIDVEGHEEKAFEGAKDLLRSGQPIIMFEALDNLARQRNMKILQDLSGEKYEFARVTRQGKLASPDSAYPGITTNNFFAIPQWGKKRFSKIALQN